MGLARLQATFRGDLIDRMRRRRGGGGGGGGARGLDRPIPRGI
jgi:hypothetical protein